MVVYRKGDASIFSQAWGVAVVWGNNKPPVRGREGLRQPHADLGAEDEVEDEKEEERGGDEDEGVEPQDSRAEAEVFLHWAEEDIQVAAFAVVALFHLGLGDEVGDFLVHIQLLGAHAAAEVVEFLGVERGPADDLVDAAEGSVNLVGA